jgi:hypothetical protein
MNCILLKGNSEDNSEGRNLHPEKSQDYASKPQRKGTFMNSASCPSTAWLQNVTNMKNLFYLKLYEKSLSHAASYTIKMKTFKERMKILFLEK